MPLIDYLPDYGNKGLYFLRGRTLRTIRQRRITKQAWPGRYYVV